MSRLGRRFVLLVTAAALFMGFSVTALAGVTPTPETPPTVVVNTPETPPTVVVNPPGGGEDCARRLVINITGCAPQGLVISGWSEYTASKYAAPTGNKRFDKPWKGQLLDTGFDDGTGYRVFGWTDAGGWIYLLDFKSSACGDQYVSYDFACVLTPTPTMTMMPTLMPTMTPLPELPETGGQGGMGVWSWALAGAVLAFAGLRWRQLLKLVR